MRQRLFGAIAIQRLGPNNHVWTLKQQKLLPRKRDVLRSPEGEKEL